MANLVVHFEIHASEPQRLIDFYASILAMASHDLRQPLQAIVSVLEIHRLDNPTDRTFAPSASGPGGPAGLLVFPLPADAYDLRAEVGLDPARLVQIDRGFASLAPR